MQSTSAGPQHTSTVDPRIEKVIGRTSVPVSVTTHGIASVREIEVKHTTFTRNQVSWNRQFTASDLIDRTWLAEIPFYVTYTLDCPRSISDLAHHNALLHALHPNSSQVRLAPRGLSRAITTANLTINNGTITNTPYLDFLGESFYSEEAKFNSGIGGSQMSSFGCIQNGKDLDRQKNNSADFPIDIMDSRLVVDTSEGFVNLDQDVNNSKTGYKVGLTRFHGITQRVALEEQEAQDWITYNPIVTMDNPNDVRPLQLKITDCNLLRHIQLGTGLSFGAVYLKVSTSAHYTFSADTFDADFDNNPVCRVKNVSHNGVVTLEVIDNMEKYDNTKDYVPYMEVRTTETIKIPVIKDSSNAQLLPNGATVAANRDAMTVMVPGIFTQSSLPAGTAGTTIATAFAAQNAILIAANAAFNLSLGVSTDSNTATANSKHVWIRLGTTAHIQGGAYMSHTDTAIYVEKYDTTNSPVTGKVSTHNKIDGIDYLNNIDSSCFNTSQSRQILSIKELTVKYKLITPVPHSLLRSDAYNECLTNIINMDLKLNYDDLTMALQLPRVLKDPASGRLVTPRYISNAESNKVKPLTIFPKFPIHGRAGTSAISNIVNGTTSSEKGILTAGGKTYDSMGFKCAVSVYETTESAKLYLRLYASAVDIPATISCACNSYIVRSTVAMKGSAVGNIVTFQTDSYTLSEVPQNIYIFATTRQNIRSNSAGSDIDGRFLSEPDTLMNISEINFRTTANVGTMSAAKDRQLFQLMKRSGLMVNEKSFLSDGNVLKVDPYKNLGGWAKGVREAFTHDFEVKASFPGTTLCNITDNSPSRTYNVSPSHFSTSTYDNNDLTATDDSLLNSLSLTTRECVQRERNIMYQECLQCRLHVVYEMVGQALISANGEMMQTSGIDRKVVMETLQDSSLRSQSDVGSGMVTLGGGVMEAHDAMKHGIKQVSHAAMNGLKTHAEVHKDMLEGMKAGVGELSGVPNALLQ